MDADLISRSALLAWGGARTIREAVGNWDELDNKAKAAVLRYAQRLKGAILDAPAVDAVPVVRCGKCKHAETDGCEDPAIYCKKWDRWEMPHNFYCGYGERKSE